MAKANSAPKEVKRPARPKPTNEDRRFIKEFGLKLSDLAYRDVDALMAT